MTPHWKVHQPPALGRGLAGNGERRAGGGMTWCVEVGHYNPWPDECDTSHVIGPFGLKEDAETWLRGDGWEDTEFSMFPWRKGWQGARLTEMTVPQVKVTK